MQGKLYLELYILSRKNCSISVFDQTIFLNPSQDLSRKNCFGGDSGKSAREARREKFWCILKEFLGKSFDFTLFFKIPPESISETPEQFFIKSYRTYLVKIVLSNISFLYGNILYSIYLSNFNSIQQVKVKSKNKKIK